MLVIFTLIYRLDKVRNYPISVVCNPFPRGIDTLTFNTLYYLIRHVNLHKIGIHNLFYTNQAYYQVFRAVAREKVLLLILILSDPSSLWIFILFFLFSCLCIAFYFCFL